MTVSTDASGNASFVFPQGGPPAGWTPRSRQPAVFKIDNPFGDGTSTAAFSATATDSAGSTSEFSQALQLFRH